MARVLAYFLTWTTYGTWLPGDGRQWVDKRGWAGKPYECPDGRRAATARSRMKQSGVNLRPGQRRAVEDAIRSVCCFKGWVIHALNVRSNHVHLVLTAEDTTPERLMTTLKAWASRRLNEVSDRHRWWTRHGSTRYIGTERSLQGAIEYVEHQ